MGRNKKNEMRGDKWMNSPEIHKGGLHRSLGIPEGKKIPEKRIIKAEHSRKPKIRKEAYLAETYKKLRPQGR